MPARTNQSAPIHVSAEIPLLKVFAETALPFVRGVVESMWVWSDNVTDGLLPLHRSVFPWPLFTPVRAPVYASAGPGLRQRGPLTTPARAAAHAANSIKKQQE